MPSNRKHVDLGSNTHGSNRILTGDLGLLQADDIGHEGPKHRCQGGFQGPQPIHVPAQHRQRHRAILNTKKKATKKTYSGITPCSKLKMKPSRFKKKHYYKKRVMRIQVCIGQLITATRRFHNPEIRRATYRLVIISQSKAFGKTKARPMFLNGLWKHWDHNSGTHNLK